MKEAIYYWRYTLRSRARLNAVSDRMEHDGALIRMSGGFGCIHPWPEMGDDPIDVQLKILSEGGRTPLIEGAIECAKFDGSLRQGEEFIFPYPFEIPDSHWLVRPGDDPGFAKDDGFTIAKIKGSPDFQEVRKEMEPWVEAGLKIRLDFNESLGEGMFLDFWGGLTKGQREAIELVEDPEQYSRDGWQRLRDEEVPVAVDFDASNRYTHDDVLVMKPAKPDWVMGSNTRFYVTSYMDHAVGQMFAAVKAAAYSGNGSNANLLPCGLLTHRCFEDDEFFERIRTEGPRLLPVEGTGLGFDDLLEKLPWKRLV